MTDDTKTISDLRAVLFATIEGVRSGTVDLDKARAINELSKTVVESAKVEVQYLEATGGGESSFIESAIGANNLPPGINGVTRHRLA